MDRLPHRRGPTVEATQNSRGFTGAVALVRAIPTVNWLDPRNRTLVDFTGAYGSVSQPGTATIKTNILHFDAEHDWYFSPRFYFLVDSSYDHNYSQGLDLQQFYGAGMGYTVIKQPKQELDLKFDIHYEKQQYFVTPGIVPPPPLTPQQEPDRTKATLVPRATNSLRKPCPNVTDTERLSFRLATSQIWTSPIREGWPPVTASFLPSGEKVSDSMRSEEPTDGQPGSVVHRLSTARPRGTPPTASSEPSAGRESPATGCTRAGAPRHTGPSHALRGASSFAPCSIHCAMIPQPQIRPEAACSGASQPCRHGK